MFRNFKENGESGYIDFRKLIHPCVASQQVKQKKKAFVPNDTKLDASNDQSLLLVTGPNMGGKSTLLRQTAIAVIMA